MNLVAIFTVWGDIIDLLPHSIKNIRPLVDKVIVVWSETSNYGEKDDAIKLMADENCDEKVFFYNFEPDLKKYPVDNERAKRNFGLQIAREQKATHFLMLDGDEFYKYSDIKAVRDNFTGNSVCATQVYFAKPTLTIGLDTTLVPFIHQLTPKLKFEWNRKYPHAFVNGQIKIDPTRQMNINDGVVMSPVIMHHYSWIRKDFKKKIRNSTARTNIERSTILQDLLQSEPGYFCQFYGKTLVEAPNVFGLPEYVVQELQSP